MSLSVTVTTADQRIVSLSAGLAAVIGRAADDLAGRPIEELLQRPFDPGLSHLLSGTPTVDEPLEEVEVRVVGVDRTIETFELLRAQHLDGGRVSLELVRPVHASHVRALDTELAEMQHRYGALVRGSADGVVIHDGTRIVFVNAAAARLAGLNNHVDPVGLPIASFIRVEDAGVLDVIRRKLAEEPLSEHRVTLRLRRLSGDLLPVEAFVAQISWNGRPAIQVVLHDLRMERRIHRSDAARIELERAVSDAVISTDEQFRITSWNAAATAMYGWTLEEVLGRDISEVFGLPGTKKPVGRSTDEPRGLDVSHRTVRHHHHDGHEMTVESSTTLLRDEDGVIEAMVEVNRPVGEFDEVLVSEKLAGRASLLARLEAANLGESFTVILADVDQFSQLNDRFGAAEGDHVLAGIAARLSASLRDGDFLARLSGDRFGMCVQVETEREARAVAGRIERLIAEPLDVSGSWLSISTSVGAAWGANTGRPDQLYEQAERALDRAQAKGGHCLVFYEPDADPAGWEDDAVFAADVREAIASGAIYVAYQPIVELATGRLRKMEALARWTHPLRGVIHPAEFIPLAERSHVIDELGEWIIRRACEDVMKMGEEGIDVILSVNLSVVQMRDPEVANRVANVLTASGLSPDRLWIEVTESVLLDDHALLPLHQLHDLGVHLVIDDFGTGYATFQYLTRLPVDALKIDMGFVSGLGRDSSDTAIVRSVVNLGRELGLEVVAEGVETESERVQLLALNCRLGQGWLFGRAARYEDFVAAYGPRHGRSPATSGVTTVANEEMRLAALRDSKILDTTNTAAFDSLVRLASQIMSTPMAMIALIDADRQWFKASVGLDVIETPREIAISAHALAEPYQPLLIRDTSLDERFAKNPRVTGVPYIRSYAGMPIRSREGFPLGAFCVMDTQPRVFTDEQVSQLKILSEQAAALIDLRRRTTELNNLNRRPHPLTIGIDPNAGGALPTTGSATEVGRVLVDLAKLRDRPQAAPRKIVNVLRRGTLEIDLDLGSVTLAGRQIDLTPKEFDLLAFLAARAGQVFSRAELLLDVWQTTAVLHNPATVTEHIYRLRAKIEPDPKEPSLLQTVRGVGYCFGPPNPADAAVTTDAAAQPRSGTWVSVGALFVAADDSVVDMLSAGHLKALIGRNVFDFVAASSHPAMLARLEMRASGYLPGPQIITLRTAHGRQLVVLLTSETGEFDGHAALFGTFREVTDPPRLMRQLVAGVVSEVSDAVIVTDPQLHVLSWNPAAQRLYGWSESEVLGHTLEDVVRGYNDQIDVTSAWEELQATGRWNHVAQQVARDGSIVTVQASVNLIRDEHGEVTGIVAVNHPIPALPSDRNVLAQNVDVLDVKRAMSRNEFVVFYEPIVALGDRHAVAVEVRTRWLRPDGGTWDAARFMDAVERAGATADLFRFVCETACLQVERWSTSGHDVALAVEVRARELTYPGVAVALMSCTSRLRAGGSALWLELPATELADATEQTYAGLCSLAAAGVQITIEDDGADWPELASLARLPVHAVKIDAVLALGSANTDTQRNSEVLRSFLAIGTELEVAAAAEGVMTEKQHDSLVRLGFGIGQGPLYGEPALGDHVLLGRGSTAAFVPAAITGTLDGPHSDRPG